MQAAIIDRPEAVSANASVSAIPTTMQAVLQRKYGSPDRVLSLQTTDVPDAVAKQVRIRIHAAGLNKGDWHLATGMPRVIRALSGLLGPSRMVPGLAVAGVVDAVGAEATVFKPGDRIYGELPNGGAFAEYTLAGENDIVRIPDSVPFDVAAAVPVAALTALQLLRDAGKVQAGQSVLVIGAGGGVGSFAIQLARWMGAHVTGVAGPDKQDLVSELGAERMIDYTTEDFAAGDARYDVVVDMVGNRAVRDYRRVLTRPGTYVSAAGGTGKWLGPLPRMMKMAMLSPFVRHRLVFPIATPDAADHVLLAELLEKGEIAPAITRRIGLEDVPAALHAMGAGHSRGRTVVVVRPDEDAA